MLNWNGNHKDHVQHYSVKHGDSWKDICLPLLKVRDWSSPFRVILNKVSQMQPKLTLRLFLNGDFLRQSNPPAAVVLPERNNPSGRVWDRALTLTWWEKWKRKHDSPPALTPCYLFCLRDPVHWIAKWVLNISPLSSSVVKHSRWCLCACRMGPPVEQRDRDDHTRACETQVEGEESQSEVSTCAPPPVSKKKRKSKRYFSVCLHYWAISTAHVASASVGWCSKADVCPALCLFSFRWLWISLANCKYGSGMWCKTSEHPLSCLI